MSSCIKDCGATSPRTPTRCSGQPHGCVCPMEEDIKPAGHAMDGARPRCRDLQRSQQQARGWDSIDGKHCTSTAAEEEQGHAAAWQADNAMYKAILVSGDASSSASPACCS